ncbi:alpha/beta-hydrolase [Rhizophagus irregularis]|uniref:Alpha/beta-hydrolase n=1 Tax=Rhizophagus irregularis TaxID=588596 RepID=A0A2N0RYX4_9GLOM|nr:alpha/beta-hydrolase [Rhizophagus irregularis]
MNFIKFLILSYFIVTVIAQVTIPVLPDDTKNYMVTGGNGVKIFVEEKGDPTKVTMVFCAPIMSSRISWEVQFNDPSLNGNFHLIRYDYRGTGRSDKPKDVNAYSTDLHVLDLNAVIDSVKSKKIILVGASIGSLVSIGSMKTEKVAGFISVSGIFNGDIPFFTNATEPSDDYQTAIDTLRGAFAFLTAKPLSDQFSSFLFGQISQTSPEFRHNKSPIPDFGSIFSNLNVPTLFLIGDKDAIVPANYSQKFVSLAKNGQKIIYTGVGHSPQWEISQTFNNDISGFAKKV